MSNTAPIEPLVIENAGGEWGADAAHRVPLFTIVDPNGLEPDRAFDMPAAQNAGMFLRYLQLGRTIGDMLAASWLIEAVIGSDGYAALVAQPKLSSTLLASLSTRIASVIGGSAVGVDYSTIDEVAARNAGADPLD